MTPAAGDASAEQGIAAVPKAELHVHLEGTLSPETARALLARRGTPPPPGLAGWFRHRSLDEFLDHYRALLDLLTSPEDYGYLAGRYLDAAPGHGLRRVEFSLSLGSALRRGHEPRPLLESIARAAELHPQVGVGVIVDTVRQFGPAAAGEVLRAVVPHRDLELLVGFGMGGDESAVPAEAFAPVFGAARDAGLRTTVHAGETGDPAAVRKALDHLHPDRIAHGIGAASDPRLLARLAAERVPLDVCVTSNLATGAVAREEEHPLRALLDAGVRVTLGTDDPGLFGTDLTREYRRAARIAGLDAAALARLAATSLEACFDA